MLRASYFALLASGSKGWSTMGKAGRWLKSILAGRKDKALRHQHKHQDQQQGGDATPLPAAASSPREKKRWSFRRPAPTQQGKVSNAAASPLSSLEPSARELDQSDHAVAVAVAAAAAAAADAAVMAAAQAAAEVARLTAAEEESHLSPVEEAAAARIQATFRGYLARKALCALRGLVKLQALVRGQLVRRQANATLRRMQALVDAQSHLRARMSDADHVHAAPAAYQYQRRSPQHPRRRSSYEVMDHRSSGDEHVKIVEMDVGEPARRGRSSFSAAATESRERRLAEYYHGGGAGGQCSPAPSSSAAFFGAELSPHRAYSGHFEDALAFDPAATARSSPYVPPYDAAAAAAAAGDGYGGVVPSYMANTESSRAKARSQSAPRQRTDAAALERQPSRRRGQLGAPSRKMQRSSSHIGVPAAAACGYGYGYGYHQHAQPWAGVRLDRSSAPMAGSECGSTSSVLTAATVGYCRSLVGFEVQRGHY